jgi:beta-galactosidase/beta-glucuronidase
MVLHVGHCSEGDTSRRKRCASLRFTARFFIVALVLVGSPVPDLCGAVRESIPLHDKWQFCFAGNDTSTAFLRHGDSLVRGTVTLPHYFPSGSANNLPASGSGWYFRDITIPASFDNKDVSLDFDGVCLRAEVFVDGVAAGGSNFAYTPFSIELTPFIRGKTHARLAVRVDNRLQSRQIPDRNAKGWWFYGGLIRDIVLAARSKYGINNAQLLTFYQAGDTFDLRLKLDPPKDVLWDSVTVTMVSVGVNHPVRKMTVIGTDTLLRLGGVAPWTPEFPHRYLFTMVPFFSGKAGDTLRLLRGFCQLTAQKTKLYLNGKPYFLRGMGRHDVRDDKGPLLNREERLRDLLDLKSLGVNFLRIAHFPQHHDIYELCDSIGLLVMDEIPAWKTDSRFLGSNAGRDFGARYMKALIAAHGNYTCVCIWSLGNQFASFKTAVADFVGDVSAEVKKADPSRLVTFCSFYYIWDKAFSHVDVIAVNEYFGWELASLGMLGPMLDKIHKDWPDKPVLVSELGAQAQLGLRNSHARLAGVEKSIFTKDLSEDHHALFIRSHLDTIWEKRSYINGMVIWAYADYMTVQNKARTPSMPVGLNACGIVTRDRKRKLSYDVVRDRYSFFKEKFGLHEDAR